MKVCLGSKADLGRSAKFCRMHHATSPAVPADRITRDSIKSPALPSAPAPMGGGVGERGVVPPPRLLPHNPLGSYQVPGW